ncbi:MAG TPA: glycosyltransferase family 4 protein [Alphaproteobacteria bacterium]|nr:glycosyltransferase family 4 protein [Alphaproteobacteria bacterium]
MGSERELSKLRELIELQARHNAVLRRAVERNIDFPEVVQIAPALAARRRYRRTRPLTTAPTTGWSAHDSGPALRPSPGWENLSLADKPCKVIAYLAFGFERPELERIVEMVSREQRRLQNFVPLFVTDSLEFDLFRLRGYVVEHVPAGDPMNYGPGLAIALRRRMQTILEKWAVGAVVQFGPLGLPAGSRESGTAIVYYPDYRPYNSYQTSFYAACPPGYSASPGTIESAIRRLGEGRATIFHLHWEDHVFRGAWPDAAAERELCRAFVMAAHYFIDGGGIFVWTVHNLQPHDKFHADVHREFQAELLALAHRVHVHSRNTLAELQARSGADIRGKVDIIAHGNYCGLKRLKRARRAGPLELLFLGQVRPYKGVDELLQALNALTASGEELHVTIAGPHHGGLDLSHLRPEAMERLTIVDRTIEESEIPGFYAAADFAVAPYRAVTTPGSIILALSLGVPVIAPALPNITELLGEAPVGLLYDPDDAHGLQEALGRARALTAEQRAALKRNALSKARDWDWSSLKGQIGDFFAAATSLASVGR